MAKKLLIIFGLIFVVNVSAVSVGYADDLSHKLGIGLGYPYLSVKYGINSRWSGELRGAFGSGIVVAGGRVYYNLNPEKRAVIYYGLEMDYVSFNTDDISGNGYLGLIFVGGEYFINKNLTVCMDIGPVYTKLADSEYSDVSVSGIDWVVNIGINFYFSLMR